MNILDSLFVSLFAWMCVALLAAILAFVAARGKPWRRMGLLPRQRYRLAAWSAFEVFLAFVAFFVISESIRISVGRAGRFVIARQYGVAYSQLKSSGDAETERQLEQTVIDARRAFRGNAPMLRYAGFSLSVPLALVAVGGIVRLGSRSRLYQIGLHTHRIRENVLLGCGLWLIGTPFISLVNVGGHWMAHQLGPPPIPHSITQVLPDRASWLNWTVLVISATIAAPIIEEVLFRGVLQGWVVRRWWHGHVLLVLASATTIANNCRHASVLMQAVGMVGAAVIIYLLCPLIVRPPRPEPAPTVFDDTASTEMDLQALNDPSAVYSMPDETAPPATNVQQPTLRVIKWLYGQFDLYGERTAIVRMRGVGAAALFFAGSHPWPTPIALVILGLMLGWLALRTQSLIGPIVYHALFNAVACVELAVAKGELDLI